MLYNINRDQIKLNKSLKKKSTILYNRISVYIIFDIATPIFPPLVNSPVTVTGNLGIYVLV